MIDALAFVVTFHKRRFMAQNPVPPCGIARAVGWQSLRWTESLEEAEKWSTEPAARAFAEATLPGGYEIRPIYGASPRSVA
jgi:hypothetical protein